MNHETRTLIVHAGGVLGLGAVLTTAYVVGIRARLEADATTVSLHRELATHEENMRAAQNDISMLEQEVVSLRRRVDESFDLRPISSRNALLAELGEMIRTAGITVDEMIPAGEEHDDGIVRVVIRLRAHGQLPDLLKLMHTLGETRPDIVVRTVEVRGEPFKRDAEQTFSVQLVWFADPAGDDARNSG